MKTIKALIESGNYVVLDNQNGTVDLRTSSEKNGTFDKYVTTCSKDYVNRLKKAIYKKNNNH